VSEPRSGLLGVPYRPLFGLGALDALLLVGLWFALAEARRRGLPFPAAAQVPPARVHAHSLFFGMFACYALGFLGTAFPRWIDAPPPTHRRVLGWLALLATAQLALVMGFVRLPLLLPLAAVLEVTAYADAIGFFARALRATRNPRRLQPALVLAALALAPVAAALDGAAFAGGAPRLHRAAVEIALRGHLLFLVAGVAQRIVPFFTANLLRRPYAPRPPWALAGWVGCGAVRLALALALDRSAGPWMAPFDAAMAGGLALELRAWRPGPALRQPMMAILYLGLAWVALGLAASALAGLRPELAPLLELPVRHALAVGGFATLVLGMSTRVALGHRGRPIVADASLVLAFASIQLAALVRVALPLLGGVWSLAPVLSHWAALPWMLAFGIWLARLGPLLLRAERVAAPAPA
jgi:uncharacterized protein involved in response to NO